MADKKPEISAHIEEVQAELESTKEALAAAKAKAVEYYDQLLRSRAEFDNFRRRVDREKSDARAWGKQEVLLKLVSLLDIFDQALDQTATAKDTRQVAEGVEMLHLGFAQFLKAEGLEAIDCVGKPLDPEKAEVLAQSEVDGDQAGLVLEEIQKGYMFQGRLLRPSRVRVGVSRTGKLEKKKKGDDLDAKEESTGDDE